MNVLYLENLKGGLLNETSFPNFEQVIKYVQRLCYCTE